MPKPSACPSRPEPGPYTCLGAPASLLSVPSRRCICLRALVSSLPRPDPPPTGAPGQFNLLWASRAQSAHPATARELASSAQNKLEPHKSLTSGFPVNCCIRERIIDLFSPKITFCKLVPSPGFGTSERFLYITKDKGTGVSSVLHPTEGMTVRDLCIPYPASPIPSPMLTR